jgi:hypothetical protein
MTHREALALIDHPAVRALLTGGAAAAERPTHWADLGSGSGTFTLALADLLAPGSLIEAIDLRPGIAAQTTSRGVTIHPRTADFTTLRFATPNAAPSTTSRAPTPNTTSSEPTGPLAPPIPDRAWPGLQPLMYHGILMANSLHYVPDQSAFLTHLKTNMLLLIEYDIDIAVPTWVPYPLSFAKATSLLQSTHWSHVQKLGTHPSAFGQSDLYAALALREE